MMKDIPHAVWSRTQYAASRSLFIKGNSHFSITLLAIIATYGFLISKMGFVVDLTNIDEVEQNTIVNNICVDDCTADIVIILVY